MFKVYGSRTAESLFVQLYEKFRDKGKELRSKWQRCEKCLQA